MRLSLAHTVSLVSQEMCVCVSVCDDRACPRLNMVTLSQRQRSLTPSECQSACWFFDIERGTDKATHQISNDWEDCRRNGFWQSAIYNLLAIPCYFNCWRLFCHWSSKVTVLPTYFFFFCVWFHKIHLNFFFLIKKILLRELRSWMQRTEQRKCTKLNIIL